MKVTSCCYGISNAWWDLVANPSCRVPPNGDKIDIYDFGVILLEVVTGRPITSIHEVEVMKEQVGDRSPPRHHHTSMRCIPFAGPCIHPLLHVPYIYSIA